MTTFFVLPPSGYFIWGTEKWELTSYSLLILNRLTNQKKKKKSIKGAIFANCFHKGFIPIKLQFIDRGHWHQWQHFIIPWRTLVIYFLFLKSTSIRVCDAVAASEPHLGLESPTSPFPTHIISTSTIKLCQENVKCDTMQCHHFLWDTNKTC